MKNKDSRSKSGNTAGAGTRTQNTAGAAAKTQNAAGRVKWLRAAAALVLVLVLLTLSVKAHLADQPHESWYFPLAAALSLLAGLYLYLPIPMGKTIGRIFTVFCGVCAPFLSFVIVEFYNKGFWHVGAALSTGTAEPPYLMILLNTLIYALFFLVLVFLTGRLWLGCCIAECSLMVLAIVNFYVVKFRGSPLMPWDLLSVRTAGNVAANYQYTVYWKMLFSTIAFLFLIMTTGRMRGRIRDLRIRIPGLILSVAALVMMVASIQDMEVKKFWGVDTTLFTPNVRYTKNGLVAAYLANLHLIHIEKPDGYSLEKVREIAYGQEESGEQDLQNTQAEQDLQNTQAAQDIQNTQAAQDTQTAQTSGAAFDLAKAPNIIVIMNEAFSDLSVIGDFNTSEDYMPFFRSMMEQYTSGYLMVSVKGGNTANTEYEFLGGDTMAFLPEGSVVFQQYISGQIPTMASYLGSLGYTTVGMHPYQGSGWDRMRVYPLMGFDRFYDQKSFPGAKTIRKYISDESAFERIIEEFEKKEQGEKKFIFEVTMQNHSGYSANPSTDNGFKEEVLLTDKMNKSTVTVAAERYLTLIKKSDEAYEKLIRYFEENVTEPTIIVTFGDHEPSDYVTEVIDGLTGFDEDGGLEETQKHYQVPFFIWNNMGLEKDETIDLMSVNFLGAYVMEKAGLPLTEYQEYLLSLRQTLPVICAGTYIDENGVYHDWNKLGKDEIYGDLINDYNILAYNHLTDAANRITEIFNEPADDRVRAQLEESLQAAEAAGQ